MKMLPIFPRGNTPLERMLDVFKRIIPKFLGKLPSGSNFFVVFPGNLGFFVEYNEITSLYNVKVCRVHDVMEQGVLADKPHLTLTYWTTELDAIEQALKLLNVDPDECFMGCGGPSEPFDSELRAKLN